jgi:transcriptional regulator with XRE-family HTH domain
MKRDWFDQLKAEWLADPEFRAEYEALGPKFELIHEFIAARARAGLTQEQLAERMGTSQSAIARIESGDRIPTVRTLQRFAEATGTRLVIKLVPIERNGAAKPARRAPSPARRRVSA